jgi:hypothetical protein
VVADPVTGPRQPEFGNLSPSDIRSIPDSTKGVKSESIKPGMAVRSRSKTNPDGLATAMAMNKPRRRSSTDRHGRNRIAGDGAPYPGGFRRMSKEVGFRPSLDQLF